MACSACGGLEDYYMAMLFFLVEQPGSSILWHVGPMKRFLVTKPQIKTIQMQRSLLWMSSYGQNMPKPTVLVGLLLGMATLFPSRRPVDYERRDYNEQWKSWVNSQGRRRVAGKPALKNSASYTPHFASHCVRLARWAKAMFRSGRLD